MIEFFNKIIFTLIVPGIIFGLVSILFSFFLPRMLFKYKLVIFLAGSAILIFFIFQAGRLNVMNKYEHKALIDKALFAEEQVKSAKIDTKIITQYVEKIKFVDRIKEVKTNVYVTKEDDSSCVISLSTSDHISRLLNSASEGRLPESTDRVDASSK